MSLAPFFKAGLVIQVHMIAALIALVLGAVILSNMKGTRKHKMLGKTWVGLMVIVALSSFFINELKTWGPFSPIHILSVVTLIALFHAIRAIRRGDIRGHKSSMVGLYIGGLVLAGVFTLMPGRIINRMLFGNPEFYLTSHVFAWVIPFFAIVIAVGFIAMRFRTK